MRCIKSRMTRGLSVGSYVETCDNSGAKIARIISIKNCKSVRGRKPSTGISSLIFVAVRKGRPDMRKQVVPAVIVRQKKAFRRPNGMRVSFEDNALVILKDEDGNPKGTILKGPVAKEVAERWPAIAKLSKIIV